MRTFTHTTTVPLTFRLDIGPGLVEIVAEDRTDAVVTLAPEYISDELATRLINRATTVRDDGLFSVTVPRPVGPTGTRTIVQADGVSVVQSARIVTGTLTGLTITGDGNIYVSGGSVVSTGRGGNVRATVRVPSGSRVNVTTDTADLRATGPLTALAAKSVSGEVTHVGTVDHLDVTTVSGGIHAAGRRVQAATTSGDMRIALDGPHAELRSVSGAISVHATTDATVTARSVSGDIRVTSDPATRVTTALRSVSGDVRTA
jgi:putative adhesin